MLVFVWQDGFLSREKTPYTFFFIAVWSWKVLIPFLKTISSPSVKSRKDARWIGLVIVFCGWTQRFTWKCFVEKEGRECSQITFTSSDPFWTKGYRHLNKYHNAVWLENNRRSQDNFVFLFDLKDVFIFISLRSIKGYSLIRSHALVSSSSSLCFHEYKLLVSALSLPVDFLRTKLSFWSPKSLIH